MRPTETIVGSMMLGGALLVGVLAAPGPGVLGDVVFLSNGKRIEGTVSPASAPTKVAITIDAGLRVEIDRSTVERIEYGPSPAEQFEQRFAQLPPGDLAACLELAAWGRERKLRTKLTRVYRRILRIDPNSEEARAGLGYVVHRNRWVLRKNLKTDGLVSDDGEWVLPGEKARRGLHRLRKEVGDDMRGVASDNTYVQEYSVRRVMERSDPWMGHILVDYLAHEEEAIRVVAIQALASLREKSARRVSRPRGAARSRGAAAGVASPTVQEARDLVKRLDRVLLQRTVEEESAVVRKALTNALTRMRSRGYFELAMNELKSSPNALRRERAAEGALFALKKSWVPEFFEALDQPPPRVPLPGNPAVRRVLSRVFNQDFEYRVADWQAWWKQNAHRYTDEA